MADLSAEQVANFDMLGPMLDSLHGELSELSKKKQDGPLNKLKIRHVNRILEQVQDCLGDDPSVNFLETLDEDEVPQNSDGVIIVGQWRAAMDQFYAKHTKNTPRGERVWLTASGEVPAARRVDRRR